MDADDDTLQESLSEPEIDEDDAIEHALTINGGSKPPPSADDDPDDETQASDVEGDDADTDDTLTAKAAAAPPRADLDEETEEEIAAQHRPHPTEIITEIEWVPPEMRLTSNRLSRFEMTEIYSIRGTQIAEYNNCFVETAGIDDPKKMAMEELKQRKCPLLLRRVVGEKIIPGDPPVKRLLVELWNPNEMIHSAEI